MSRLRIVFLGTGNAFNTDGRGSQAIWIEPEGGPVLLVDAGPTALAAMERFGLRAGAIDKVFFTHLHGDHIAGWPFLLLHQAFIARRSRPLEVKGPEGTETRLADLTRACYDELLEPGKLAFDVTGREVAVAEATGLDAGGGVRFDVVPLEHHPTSVGYRIHAGGVSVGVTGDTRWCPGLERLGEGCDLLILECTSIHKQEYAHVSLDELRENVSRLGAKQIVLVHLSNDIARALQERPIDGVRAADDGMRLEL